jgi:dihydrofolate reductase
MNSNLKIIAAMAQNRVIGHGDGLPWDVPEEYEHYRQTIADQTVIMGRRSFEIFGADLTSRHAIVVSKSGKSISGAFVCRSLEEAVDRAQQLGLEIYINGGASIYTQAMPLVDEMLLSIIKGDYSGDAYFPAFDQQDWELTQRKEAERYEFRRYRRRAPGERA